MKTFPLVPSTLPLPQHLPLASPLRCSAASPLCAGVAFVPGTTWIFPEDLKRGLAAGYAGSDGTGALLGALGECGEGGDGLGGDGGGAGGDGEEAFDIEAVLEAGMSNLGGEVGR